MDHGLLDYYLSPEFLSRNFPCPSGGTPPVLTKLMAVESGAICRIAAQLREFIPGKRALVVADSRTWEVAGDALSRNLASGGCQVQRRLVPDPPSGKIVASVDLVEKLDYCGLVSGRDVDKSEVFEVFYGKLENVPMIRECPVCVECTVQQMVELPDHFVVFGEVKHVYTEERYMTGGALDPTKMNPIIFTRPGPKGIYWTLAHDIGQAWSIGKRLKES